MRSLVRLALVLIGLGGVTTACTAQYRVLLVETATIDGWTYWIAYAGLVAVVVGVAVGKGTHRPPRPR